MIKAITLDLWGTLIHENNRNRLVRDYVSQELGQSIADSMFITKQTKMDFVNYFKNNVGYKESKHLLSIINKQTKNYTTFADIKYILPLMKDYKLGLISNASFVSHELIQKWPYKKIFDVITISYEIESPKPEKKIFEFTSKKLNVPLKNILHIGNSYLHDYSLPKEHGINTLLLDRKNEHKEIKERITSFKQLENYLKKINKN